MSKRACRPGDVLYQSPKFYGGAYFSITLQSLPEIPQPVREVKLESIKAILCLRIFIPSQEDSDALQFKFVANDTKILHERLNMFWGQVNDIVTGHRFKYEHLQVQDIVTGVSLLKEQGNQQCETLAELAKKHDETLKTMLKLQQQMCEAYQIEDV